MSNVVVVGAQWGDEGKGKIIDQMAAKANMVVRYQGGNNAGHTVVVGDQKFVLHHIPCGALHAHVTSVIGPGVVVDLEVLLGELEQLAKRGQPLEPDRLKISELCNVIMPYHRLVDQLREQRLGDARVGTTGRGIGPTYEDFVARRGIRLQHLSEPEMFNSQLDRVLDERNEVIRWLGGEPVSRDELIETYRKLGERIKPYLCDISGHISQAMKSNREVLFEGAQGSLLDLTHGTYPFVTSSSTIAGGVCTSIGMGPTEIDWVMGVAKAYTTRVGAGPFPTEQDNEVGEFLQQQGAEFGSTTGRRRRCGWLDGPALRYAIRINGISSLAITKLDVLSGLEEIKVCVGYEYQGGILSELPTNPRILADSTPIYERFKGWDEDISDVTVYGDLPEAAKEYLQWIEVLTNRKIVVISCGPDRGQTMLRDIGLYKEISKEVVGESGSVS